MRGCPRYKHVAFVFVYWARVFLPEEHCAVLARLIDPQQGWGRSMEPRHEQYVFSLERLHA